jgi:predicted small lipoprotein YifL
MVPAIEELVVKRSLCLPLVMIGALAAALPLSACGRKGSLDPPPGGMALDARTARTPVSGQGLRPDQPEFDAQGRPVAPTGPKRRIPADWLLD